jgi:hypothetical protein
MTDKQINAAIAEACGWKEITNCTCGGKKRGCPPGGHASSHTPNYCGDLNAMHEAEKVLKNIYLLFEYGMHISNSHHYEYLLTATARQRAEAFLRTLGKWEEGE